MHLFYYTSRFLIKVLFRLYFGLRVEGEENMPRGGGVLLVSNHASYLDPPLLAVATRRRLNFMARDTLFRPGFGFIIRALGAFPIKRGKVDRAALKECVDRVGRDEVVLMFPEGTRTRDGRLQDPKPGAAMLVRMTRGKVVPAYVKATYEAWSKGGKLPQRVPLTVVFGPPVEIEDLRRSKDKKASEEILTRIMDSIRVLEEKAERMGKEKSADG